jgi:hypothetical protein
MLASEAQVVFEYFRRGSPSQIVDHSVPLSLHIRCKAARPASFTPTVIDVHFPPNSVRKIRIA